MTNVLYYNIGGVATILLLYVVEMSDWGGG